MIIAICKLRAAWSCISGSAALARKHQPLRNLQGGFSPATSTCNLSSCLLARLWCAVTRVTAA